MWSRIMVQLHEPVIKLNIEYSEGQNFDVVKLQEVKSAASERNWQNFCNFCQIGNGSNLL